MARNLNLTDTMKNEIINLYLDGKSEVDIAMSLSIGANTVSYIIRKANITNEQKYQRRLKRAASYTSKLQKRYPDRLIVDVEKEICWKYLDTPVITFADIGRLYGLDEKEVRSLLKRYNVFDSYTPNWEYLNTTDGKQLKVTLDGGELGMDFIHIIVKDRNVQHVAEKYKLSRGTISKTLRCMKHWLYNEITKEGFTKRIADTFKLDDFLMAKLIDELHKYHEIYERRLV